MYDYELMKINSYLIQNFSFNPQRMTKEELRKIKFEFNNIDSKKEFNIHSFFTGLEPPEKKLPQIEKPIIPRWAYIAAIWGFFGLALLLVLIIGFYIVKIMFLKFQKRRKLREEAKLNYVYDLKDF